MRRYVRAAGTNSGFTLVEVILATALLATAAAAVIVVYVRAIEQASAARDLTYATSVARNALGEAWAAGAEPVEDAALPGRAGLTVTYEASAPEGDEEEPAAADAFLISIRDAGGAPVVSLGLKRAIYLLPEEEEIPGVEDPDEFDAVDEE